MFTLAAYLTSALFLRNDVGSLLFWLLTAFVVWGFVDICTTTPSKFEVAKQPLAMWLLGHVFFGPVATLGWLVIRRKVKSSHPLTTPGSQGSLPLGPAYPYQQPYVPPHRHPNDDAANGPPPPLR